MSKVESYLESYLGSKNIEEGKSNFVVVNAVDNYLRIANEDGKVLAEIKVAPGYERYIKSIRDLQGVLTWY